MTNGVSVDQTSWNEQGFQLRQDRQDANRQKKAAVPAHRSQRAHLHPSAQPLDSPHFGKFQPILIMSLD